MELFISKSRNFDKRQVLLSAYVVLVPTPDDLKLIEKYHLDPRVVWPEGHTTVTDLLIGIHLENPDVLSLELSLVEIGEGVNELITYCQAADAFYGDTRVEIG